MWPWEHLAVGYLLYSALTRYRNGESPTAAAALAVAVGTQFPDLVDKPLAWGLDVVASGVSVAHSMFTAVALSTVVVLLAHRIERPRMGEGFAVGYLSHLPADAVYGVVFDGSITVRPFMWPLFEAAPSGRGGLFDNVAYYFVRFLVFLTTDRGIAFLSLEVVLLSFAAWIWIRDGCPGLPGRSAVAGSGRSEPPL